MASEKKVVSFFFYKYQTKVKYLFNNLFFFGWESDILCFLDSGYLSEYEVKTSYEDLLNDKQKVDKYTGDQKYPSLKNGRGPNRFYYVIPLKIYDKCIKEIPDFAGIVTFSENGVSRITLSFVKQREAKLLHRSQFTESMLKKAFLSTYYKNFNNLIKNRFE